MQMRIMTEHDKEKLKRKHKQGFLFNELELAVFNQYCEKYHITNKARFMRETIITAILKQFDQDYPTLFDHDEMRRITKRSNEMPQNQ